MNCFVQDSQYRKWTLVPKIEPKINGGCGASSRHAKTIDFSVGIMSYQPHWSPLNWRCVNRRIKRHCIKNCIYVKSGFQLKLFFFPHISKVQLSKVKWKVQTVPTATIPPQSVAADEQGPDVFRVNGRLLCLAPGNRFVLWTVEHLPWHWWMDGGSSHSQMPFSVRLR